MRCALWFACWIRSCHADCIRRQGFLCWLVWRPPRTGKEHFIHISQLRPDTCKATPSPYAPLGPQCPLLARKFPPETAEAVLNLLSDCKNRLKILHLEDCQRHHMRRLLDEDGLTSAGVSNMSSLANGTLPIAAERRSWQLAMQALASTDAAALTQVIDQELIAAAAEGMGNGHRYNLTKPITMDVSGQDFVELLADVVL